MLINNISSKLIISKTPFILSPKQMNNSYFDQFNISKLFYIKLRETTLSFRNLSLILILIILTITLIEKRNKIIIRRTTTLYKIIFTIAYTLTKEHLNLKIKTILPFILNLLILLTTINLIGLLPLHFNYNFPHNSNF